MNSCHMRNPGNVRVMLKLNPFEIKDGDSDFTPEECSDEHCVLLIKLQDCLNDFQVPSPEEKHFEIE